MNFFVSLNNIRLLMSIHIHSFLYLRELEAKSLQPANSRSLTNGILNSKFREQKLIDIST